MPPEASSSSEEVVEASSKVPGTMAATADAAGALPVEIPTGGELPPYLSRPKGGKAMQAKEKGNDHFKQGKTRDAIACYTEAIETCSESDHKSLLPTVYANRSVCWHKLGDYNQAIVDASIAIKYDPGYAKGWLRRGVALMGLKRLEEANRDLSHHLTMCPESVEARTKLLECRAKVASKKPIVAVGEDIAVPASYQGPVYERGSSNLAAFCKELLQWQKDQKTLAKRYAYMIVNDIIQLMHTERSLARPYTPACQHFTVCGDVHGQYYDLINIFEMNGMPSPMNPYLFNGDFVDRGSFSCEVILLLFSLKLSFPEAMHLARGNHETINMNKLYGFAGEIDSKYDERLYDLFCAAFCKLPLCHVLNKEIFVVHGGLFARDNVTLDDLDRLERDCEPPDHGLISELLWSDPKPTCGREPSKRGVGVCFGPDVTRKFLEKNDLKMVVRSHEMKEEGYSIEHGGQLVTVFSAPNYCDQMGNKGAYIRFNVDESGSMKPKYVTFSHVSHPYVQPMRYANTRLLGSLFSQLMV